MPKVWSCDLTTTDKWGLANNLIIAVVMLRMRHINLLLVVAVAEQQSYLQWSGQSITGSPTTRNTSLSFYAAPVSWYLYLPNIGFLNKTLGIIMCLACKILVTLHNPVSSTLKLVREQVLEGVSFIISCRRAEAREHMPPRAHFDIKVAFAFQQYRQLWMLYPC